MPLQVIGSQAVRGANLGAPKDSGRIHDAPGRHGGRQVHLDERPFDRGFALLETLDDAHLEHELSGSIFPSFWRNQ